MDDLQVLGATQVRRAAADLAALALPASGGDLIDIVAACERAKSLLASIQAAATSRLDLLQRAAAPESLPTGRLDEGIAAQIGLARHESPHRAAGLLDLARRLERDLPHTKAALRSGELSEYRASLVARETALLTFDQRLEVDRLIASDPAQLSGWGDRRLVNEVRRHAYRLDAEGFVAHVRHAETRRRVTVRPTADCMAFLTALLPVAQAVACQASLSRTADQMRATGDARSRGQMMADTLVERLTGQADAEQVPVSIQLLISDEALLGDSTEPALLVGRTIGSHPVPAGIARRLVATSPAVATTVRRLYTDPARGGLVAMESRSRHFDGGLAEFVTLRDQSCRTPWCNAPIRQTDHVVALADGGLTSAANAQGLCERCNQSKQASGWHAVARDGPGRHGVVITTPTGHHYGGDAPDPPAPVDRPPPPTTQLAS